MKTIIVDDINIKIGENATENWELSFTSNKDYTWVHLASFPSAHVIIEDIDPNVNIIKSAGMICKENSKYRNLRNVKISSTKCSNLKKGEKPGEVYFKSNRKVIDYLI